MRVSSSRQVNCTPHNRAVGCGIQQGVDYHEVLSVLNYVIKSRLYRHAKSIALYTLLMMTDLPHQTTIERIMANYVASHKIILCHSVLQEVIIQQMMDAMTELHDRRCQCALIPLIGANAWKREEEISTVAGCIADQHRSTFCRVIQSVISLTCGMTAPPELLKFERQHSPSAGIFICTIFVVCSNVIMTSLNSMHSLYS